MQGVDVPSIILIINFKCLLNIRVKATATKQRVPTTDLVDTTQTTDPVLTEMTETELILNANLIIIKIRDKITMESMIDMRRFPRKNKNLKENLTTQMMKTRMKYPTKNN